MQACHWGLIPANPAINVVRPRQRKREMTALDREQLIRLLDASKDHPYNAMFVVFGTTGLRLGEALGLKWEDVDLISGRLIVRRALQRHRGKGLVFVPLKTASSYRTVVLSRRAIDACAQSSSASARSARMTSGGIPSISSSPPARAGRSTAAALTRCSSRYCATPACRQSGCTTCAIRPRP
jgi:integrase